MRPGTATNQTVAGATPSRPLFNSTNATASNSNNNNGALPRVSTAPAGTSNSNTGRVGFTNDSNSFFSSGDNNNKTSTVGGNFDTLMDFGNLNNNNNVESGERTPLSSAIENALMTVKQCELNASSLTDRLAELQQNLIKSKQLEAEMGPRESETKNVVAAFQRLVDVGTKVKKGSGKRGGGGGGNNNTNDSDHDHRDDVSESQVSRSEAATNAGGGGGGGGDDKNNSSNVRRRFGINLPTGAAGSGNLGAGKDGDLTRDEVADRDAVRHLSHKIRNLLTPVFSDVFFMESTQRESQKAAYLQQQADDQAAREALLANAAANGDNPKAARASRRAVAAAAQQQQQQQNSGVMPAAGKAGGGGPNSNLGGASLPGTFNPLVDRLDPDLYLVPGIDPSFFQDLLNLRQSRLTAEKALKKTQDQLGVAQGIVTKRRNDGSNKAALRKAEKLLLQAQTSLRELQRQKEEREIRRRLEAAAAADASSAAQQRDQGGIGSMGGSANRKAGASMNKPPAKKK